MATEVSETMHGRAHFEHKDDNIEDIRSNKTNRILVVGIVVIIMLLLAIVILLAMLLSHTSYLNDTDPVNDGFTIDSSLPATEPTETPSSCDSEFDINMAFSKTNNNQLRIYNSPNQVLPGMEFFTYSYNLLQGKPPFDLLLSGDYHQIFKLTFNSGKVTAGSKAYLVPDQLNLPALTGVCESQSQSSSIGSSTSSSSLYNAAQSRYVLRHCGSFGSFCIIYLYTCSQRKSIF